jgi:hypothetical protein
MFFESEKFFPENFQHERSTSSAASHTHTQVHHPTLSFFNRLTPLSVTLHFFREFIRKNEHGTCSATLFRAYSLNPKNCDEAKRPGQNRGVIVSACPVTGRPKGRAGVFVLEKPKMALTACSPGHRSNAVIVAALEKLWTITLEDIEAEWMDLMVKRLFSELNRQLLQIENQKPEHVQPGERLQNARTLASLQHTLKELARLERERETVRESKVKKPNARKTLESRLDQLAGRTAKAGVPDESK